MPNTHVNKLKIVYFIQEYTKLRQSKGIPNTRIIKNLSVLYPISITTFYNYMGMNAKSQLRQSGIVPESLDQQKDFIVNLLINCENQHKKSLNIKH